MPQDRPASRRPSCFSLGSSAVAILTTAVLLAIVMPAFAETLTVTPSNDTTLYESPSGSLANGAGDRLFAGRTDQDNGFRRRALLRFDVGSIPAGSTVNSVQLDFQVSRTRGSSSRILGFHRVTSSWTEGPSNASGQEGTGAPSLAGDATWLHRTFPGALWNQAGGDFATSASGSVAVRGPGSYSLSSTAQLVADVQSWVDTPASNAGWIVIGEETVSSSVKRFDSRESATPVSVTIEYDPPAVPEIACRESRVNAGIGAGENVLLVNGSAGNAQRVVAVSVGSPLTVTMSPSTSGPSPAPFVMYLHLGEPSPSSVSMLPKGLGDFCFSTPITGGSPHKIWNNIGRANRIGTADFPSTPAPSTPIQAPQGAPAAATVTLQAIVLDDGSAAQAPASITNAVILRIQ